MRSRGNLVHTWHCMYLYFQFTILWFFKNLYIFKLWWTWTECTHFVYHYTGYRDAIRGQGQSTVIWNAFLSLFCQYGTIDTVTISIKYYFVLFEICWIFKYTWPHCHQVSSSQYSALSLRFNLKCMYISSVILSWGLSWGIGNFGNGGTRYI